MTPRAESAEPPAQAAAAASEKLLQDGELILLAVKPSGWFVLLISWPVLVVAAAIAAGAILAAEVLHATIPGQMVCLLCLAAASLRLAFACGQWVGRLYVLTSRRILSVRGLGGTSVADCPLKKLASTEITSSTGERLLRIGTLLFAGRDEKTAPEPWEYLSQPDQVRALVEEAMQRAT